MAARSSKKTCQSSGDQPSLVGRSSPQCWLCDAPGDRALPAERRVRSSISIGRAFGKGEHIARLDRELCRVFRSNLSGRVRTDSRRPCAREQPNGRLLARAQSTFVRHLGRQRREPGAQPSPDLRRCLAVTDRCEGASNIALPLYSELASASIHHACQSWRDGNAPLVRGTSVAALAAGGVAAKT